MSNTDLHRVAINCKLDLEAVFQEVGGFWVIENESGTIDTSYGMPCGWEGHKSCFYYEEVIEMQEMIKMESTK